MKVAATLWMMFPESKKWATPALNARRLPGQSLRDQKEWLTDNWLIPLFFTTAFFWVLWLVVDLQARSHRPPQPKVFLCLAIVATGVSTIKFGRLFRQFRNLNRGERGELLVAEQLEELRSLGFRCFHDLVRDGFNIDHVVVGPAGVYAIETKYRSGSGLVGFRNGQGIFVGGREEERDCLKQAKGNAATLHKLIRQHAGIEAFVKPLVVFVGNWKVKNDWQSTDVRVLTAGNLGRYFEEQDQPELTRREIDLICSHLNRTARAA